MKYCFVILLFVALAAGQDPSLFCNNEATCCQGLPDLTSLGNWENCTVFYMCFSEMPTPNSCSNPDQPNYNPETTRCATEVDGCLGGTREPPVSSTTQMPSTLPPVTPSTTGSPGNGNCTEDGAYFVPYPGDCKKYMICSNFVLLPEVQECPSGTLFDPDLRECNLESLVECKPTCPDTETIRIPHDTNCSLYWLCSFGTANLRQCPPGLLFDPILSSCNVEEQVFCPNLCPPEGAVNLPHSTNCSLYWLCTFGDPTLKQCPPNLFFDPEISQCNIADEVDCPNIEKSFISQEDDEWFDVDNLSKKKWRR